MTSKKELKAAYILAFVLLAVAVLSYTAFSRTAPDDADPPARMMFDCVAGSVMFGHGEHTDDSGYGLECSSCHHHPEDDESANQACGACHNLPEDGSLPQSCLECHDEGDFDASVVIKRSEAFHKQCIGCHVENDAGPLEKDCNLCHQKPFKGWHGKSE